jgi:error-prone DNA polymerase
VGLFNNQPMGFYSLDALGRDARRNGIRTLLPDVNRSRVVCTSEEDDLRIGLGFVRGWGADIAERVVEERDRNGPFRSLSDFLRRTPAALKRPAIENLIWVGGFEGFGLTRRELLWQAGLWLGPETDDQRTGGRHDHAQTELALDEPYAGLAFPDLGETDRMVAEYRMLRFSTELHPLSLLKDQLPPGTVTSDRLPGLRQHATVNIAGLVTARQRPGTAKGYVFVLMEDEAGPVNVIVKPDIYERDKTAVRMEPFLAVRGRLQKDGDTLNVIAFEVRALRVPGTPVRRSGLSRSYAASGGSAPAANGLSVREGGSVHASSDGVGDELPDAGALHAALPETLEYWADPGRASPTPFRYLTALRQSPPGIKSFG